MRQELNVSFEKHQCVWSQDCAYSSAFCLFIYLFFITQSWRKWFKFVEHLITGKIKHSHFFISIIKHSINFSCFGILHFGKLAVLDYYAKFNGKLTSEYSCSVNLVLHIFPNSSALSSLNYWYLWLALHRHISLCLLIPSASPE